MSLTVAIQMDPIETINIETDSTFMLALEARERGHKLFHYLPSDLSLLDRKLFATARPVLGLKREFGAHCNLGGAIRLDFSEIDVVLMRQDPPFDMAYITATHLLEHAPPSTLVVNNPKYVRNAPEKLFVTRFEGLLPPTLISSDRDQILKFRETHKDIIIKPLYGNGGAEVFHLKPDDENIGSLLEMFSEKYREPVIIQRYLPEIREGDKRIILVDGQPAGAVLRIPADGDSRANFHAGGGARKTSLSSRDLEICAAIGPALSDRGLLFVGIDVIGNYLTEINVTSPTGIQEINRLDGVRVEQIIWNSIEAKFVRVS